MKHIAQTASLIIVLCRLAMVPAAAQNVKNPPPATPPTTKPSADEPLTTAELAKFLGIESWVSKLHLKGSKLKLEVFRIVDGNTVGTLIEPWTVIPTDQEFMRLVVLASETIEGTKVHLIFGKTGNTLTGRPKESVGKGITLPLPPTIGEGDYILKGSQVIQGPDNTLKNIKSGLLLRVTKA